MHYCEWHHFQPKQKQKISLICNWALVIKKYHNENINIRVIFISQIVVSLKSTDTPTYSYTSAKPCMTSIVMKYETCLVYKLQLLASNLTLQFFTKSLDGASSAAHIKCNLSENFVLIWKPELYMIK